MATEIGATKNDDNTWTLNFILENVDIEDDESINHHQFYKHLINDIPALMYAYVKVSKVLAITAKQETRMKITINTPSAMNLYGMLAVLMDAYQENYGKKHHTEAV